MSQEEKLHPVLSMGLAIFGGTFLWSWAIGTTGAILGVAVVILLGVAFLLSMVGYCGYRYEQASLYETSDMEEVESHLGWFPLLAVLAFVTGVIATIALNFPAVFERMNGVETNFLTFTASVLAVGLVALWQCWRMLSANQKIRLRKRQFLVLIEDPHLWNMWLMALLGITIGICGMTGALLVWH